VAKYPREIWGFSLKLGVKLVDIKIKDIWEEFHREGNRYWLTGSNIKGLSALHKIDLETKDKTILEVGVGFGQLVRHFAENNKMVAIDISNTALRNVSDIARAINVSNFDLLEDESIDLAICHLVLQHCKPDMVKWIITNAVRTLKPGGLFSFQFADRDNSEIQPDDIIHEGFRLDIMHFYPREEIEEILQEIPVDFEIVNIRFFPNVHNITWYVVHCHK
jgi:SAM-dependent methyltransferase